MPKAMTKYQLDHFRDKVKRNIDPLIEQAELMVKQYKTIETNKAMKILSKKMGADKILARFKKLEDEKRELQSVAKTFFKSKATKDQKEDLSYKFSGSNSRYSYRDNEDITLSDCEEQLRTWASNIADKLIEKRPEGKKLAELQQTKRVALDTVMEANAPADLIESLNKVFGNSWNENVPQITA
jgi:hypothetical protein